MSASHFDVWLTTANRVYQAVPYEVLSDWLQQGRVVGADRVRTAGAGDWQTVEAFPILAVYLPQPEPVAMEDRSEALEPVELGIPIRRIRDDDQDVDMVPLIDISLVLLIFFMMTTTVAIAGSRITVPETQFATLTTERGTMWIGIDFGPGGQPVYSFASGDAAPLPDDDKLSIDTIIERVRGRLRQREAGQTLNVRVAAHVNLPIETVQTFTVRLSTLRSEGLGEIKAEVQEKPK